jgi:hypothetical protein
MTSINVKELLNNFLDNGKIIIAIDSNTEGTVLPDFLQNSIQVKLNLSHKFHTTVFEIDDDKVTVDLTFSGNKFMCTIPLKSIYYVAMAEEPLDGIEIIENMPFELIKLSYELALAEEADMELEDKTIDFLANIPSDKAEAISKNLQIDEDSVKPSTTSDLSNKLFADFMSMVSHDRVRESLSDIATKIHSSKTRRSNKRAKGTNEIKLTKKHFNKDKR